jgi:hypothetical protein
VKQPPRRRYCLIATVQGDTPDELRRSVVELVEWLDSRGTPPESGEGLLAGPSRSRVSRLEVRPNVTPEKYQEELARYVADTRLPVFEAKTIGVCCRCDAAIHHGARFAEHEGKYLCDDCYRGLV